MTTARPADAPSRSAELKEGQKQKRKRVPTIAIVPLFRELPVYNEERENALERESARGNE